MFVFGVVLGLPGTMLARPEFVERLDLTLASRGTLISSLFFGLLIGSAMSGPIVDRVGRRRALGVSAALVAMCLPVLSIASSFVLAAAALASLGLASAGVNTAGNAIASELFPDQRARRMNLIAIAVGLGGLTLPMSAAISAGRVRWELIVGAAALLAFAVALGAWRVPAPENVGRGHVLTVGEAVSVLRQPGMRSFGLAVMLAASTDASLGGWTTTYLTGGGFSPEAATWTLAAYWGSMIVGRVLLAAKVDRHKESAVVRAGLATAASVLFLVVVRQPALMLVAPPLAGLAISIAMPTLLAAAGERYPRYAGTLFGVLLTLAQVGGMLVPSIIGAVAERAGVRAGLSVLVLTSLIIAATVARIQRTRARVTP